MATFSGSGATPAAGSESPRLPSETMATMATTAAATPPASTSVRRCRGRTIGGSAVGRPSFALRDGKTYFGGQRQGVRRNSCAVRPLRVRRRRAARPPRERARCRDLPRRRCGPIGRRAGRVGRLRCSGGAATATRCSSRIGPVVAAQVSCRRPPELRPDQRGTAQTSGTDQPWAWRAVVRDRRPDQLFQVRRPLDRRHPRQRPRTRRSPPRWVAVDAGRWRAATTAAASGWTATSKPGRTPLKGRTAESVRRPARFVRQAAAGPRMRPTRHRRAGAAARRIVPHAPSASCPSVLLPFAASPTGAAVDPRRATPACRSSMWLLIVTGLEEGWVGNHPIGARRHLRTSPLTGTSPIGLVLWST